MNLYWIKDEARYVHRQSDIPKGAEFEKHDIPTDLAGLMGVLNVLHHQIVVGDHEIERLESKLAPAIRLEPAAPVRTVEIGNFGPLPVLELPEGEPGFLAPHNDMSAEAHLSRMDNPGGKVDEVVEFIMKSKGNTLKRMAGAVALAFQRLER